MFPRGTVIPFAIFLGAVAVFLLRSDYSKYGFPLDDGWIHRVYARSFAFGRGFEYNDGEQEAGSTSPLWAIVSAPAHWAGPLGPEKVVLAVKAVGIILGLVTLLGVVNVGALLTGSRTAGVIAASLFAAAPRFVFSALSGMENILLIALWVYASYALMARKWTLASVLIALTPVTRPEAVVLVPVGAVVLLVVAGKSVPGSRKLVLLAVSLAPAVLWCLFCLSVTGHPLPNTFYVKGQPLHVSSATAWEGWRGVTQHGYAALPLFPIGLLVYVVLIITRRSGKDVEPAALLFYVVAPLAYLLGVMGTRTVFLLGYYWTRWIDPSSLMLTAVFSIGYGALLTLGPEAGILLRRKGRKRVPRRTRRLGWLATGVSIAGLAVFLPALTRSFLDRRDHLSSDARAIHLLDVRTAWWVNRNIPADATVGVLDAGAIRYFGRRRTIDLAGLNSADVAFQRKTSEELLEQLDWLAVFPALMPHELLSRHFVERQRFKIPVQEYTISFNPLQTTKSIYERTRRRVPQ